MNKLYVTKQTDHEYSHIMIAIVDYDGTTPTNTRYDWSEDKPNEFYDNLVFRCQISKGHEKSYGHEVRYQDIYQVGSVEIGKMSKTINRIERALEKVRVNRGYCRDFAEFAGRVSEILKIEFVFATSESESGWYSDGRYAEIDRQDGIAKIGLIETKLIEQHADKVA